MRHSLTGCDRKCRWRSPTTTPPLFQEWPGERERWRCPTSKLQASWDMPEQHLQQVCSSAWVGRVCVKRRPHEVSKQNIWFWSQLFTLFSLLVLWWISIVFTVKHCIWKRFPSVQQTSKQWFTLQQRLSWCQRWLKGVHHLTLLLITEWTWSLTGRFERFDCCVCNTMLFIHWQSGCQASQSDTSAGTLLKTPARRFLH